MASKAEIRVEILVMDRHFLYLPLYLAQFDHPKSGKLPFFGKVPPQYSVEVKLPQRESDRTDAAVFDTLMDTRLSSSDIMFAVCDPTVLIERQDENALMAASLISSSAFWAVNHDVKDVRLFSDLSSFKRILCYKDNTTSNLIARRIAKQDTSKLHVVKTTDEIQALEMFGEGTLAISPELLKIANFIHGPLRPGEKRAQIVLELCTTKEFSNVLTTALFTRAEVVEKHPKLVSGLLAALQSALLAIHAGHSMVAECARHNYKDTFCLDEALAIANSGNVFPETIHVRRDRWQRACEFYYISHAMAEGRVKHTLTKVEQLGAEKLYRQAVLDRELRRLVTVAITRGFGEALDAGSAASADGARMTSRLRVIWAFGLMAAAFVAGHAFAVVAPGAKIAMVASWALMLLAGWWSGELAGYRKPSSGYAAHWISFALLWWALHELVVPRVMLDAHFVEGVSLDDPLAGAILTLATAWVIGVGSFVRFKVRSEAKKATSASHER